jgi:hypothetical protein
MTPGRCGHEHAPPPCDRGGRDPAPEITDEGKVLLQRVRSLTQPEVRASLRPIVGEVLEQASIAVRVPQLDREAWNGYAELAAERFD